MATQQSVIDLINQEITDNANNEITASVLRPVLIEMVNQINTLVGNPNSLTKTDVISEINEIKTTQPQGLTILSGYTNPNDSKSLTGNVGDFYKHLNDLSEIIGTFVFNGIEWVEILSEVNLTKRKIKAVSISYTVVVEDFTVIYTGNSALDTIDIPDASQNPNRILILVNQSGNDINTVGVYQDFNGADVTLIPQLSSITIQSSGTKWIRNG